MFEAYGKIADITMKEGRDNYAFIEFEDINDAEEACNRLLSN